MATTIVPLAPSAESEELVALTAQLIADGVFPEHAPQQAIRILDDLKAFAMSWDAFAEECGHPDTRRTIAAPHLSHG